MVLDDAATDGASMEMLLSISEVGADSERLDELAYMLRGELIDLADKVHPATSGDAPEGTRGLDIAAAGALFVGLKGTAASVSAVVSAVRSWLRRGTSKRTIELTIAGATLRLDAATERQQQQLVDEFVRAVGRT